MWKPEHRATADRRGLRYPSDLTDAEWALVAPLISPAKRGGRPRSVDIREVLNAIFYVLWTGCQWKALPKDLPPRSTVWDWFRRFRDERLFEGLGHRLVLADRERCGRPASPSAAVMDSQTARTCESRRAARLRRRQAHRRSQAPRAGRYRRPIADGRRRRSVGSGP